MPVVNSELLEASALHGCCIGSRPGVRPPISCECALDYGSYLLPAVGVLQINTLKLPEPLTSDWSLLLQILVLCLGWSTF